MRALARGCLKGKRMGAVLSAAEVKVLPLGSSGGCCQSVGTSAAALCSDSLLCKPASAA
jgi:hypothetical protein